MIEAKDLKEYGLVEKCKEVNGTFHIIITKGFNDNIVTTMECLKKINSAIGKVYPSVKKLITDTDNFEYIAKPKN